VVYGAGAGAHVEQFASEPRFFDAHQRTNSSTQTAPSADAETGRETLKQWRRRCLRCNRCTLHPPTAYGPDVEAVRLPVKYENRQVRSMKAMRPIAKDRF